MDFINVFLCIKKLRIIYTFALIQLLDYFVPFICNQESISILINVGISKGGGKGMPGMGLNAGVYCQGDAMCYRKAM